MKENLKIEQVSIDSLKPYEKNAKLHPKKQIEQIKESIQRFGMNDPIGIWGKDNLIVEGHGRYLACKELGITEVPCIRLDSLTDEQRREYTLIHNKTTMNSGFDEDMLAEELKKIAEEDKEINMADFDFDLRNLEEEAKEDDFDGELPEEPKSKPKEVWILGAHRLMCGDSTKADDVKKLMGGGTSGLADN